MLLVLSGLRGLTALVKDEVQRMPVSIDIHENEFLEEIYQEGVEKGIAKGPLSANLKQRLEPADLSHLERWSRRVLKSSTLEEIFQ